MTGKRQAAISAQLKEPEAKLERLTKGRQEKAKALEVLQEEVATLRKASQPVLRSRGPYWRLFGPMAWRSPFFRGTSTSGAGRRKPSPLCCPYL